uniref:RNA and export factor-binding protein 2 n=1 Tax=Rhizophora mucronata TaxID=61149 RepID=A0A2P2J9G4_RHIMU
MIFLQISIKILCRYLFTLASSTSITPSKSTARTSTSTSTTTRPSNHTSPTLSTSRNSIRISKGDINSWGCCGRSCNICSHDLYLHRFPIKLNIVVSLNSSQSICPSREDNFCRSLRKRGFSKLQAETQRIHPKDAVLCQTLFRYLRSTTPIIVDGIPLQITHF